MTVEEPVAWQYRGPDPGQGAILRTRPKLNHENWYPLYAGPTGFVPPPIPPEPPEPHCSVCGQLESETVYGMLIDIRVIAHDGEEGFADITQLLCDEHFEEMQKKLIEFGFKDHRHGGANFLAGWHPCHRAPRSVYGPQEARSAPGVPVGVTTAGLRAMPRTG